MYDRPDAFALMHEIKSPVDIFKRHRESDELVDLDVAFHILVDHTRQLRTSFATAERCASPNSTCHQLEGTSGDFLSGTGNAHDDRFTPALVATLKRRAHQVGVTDTFK
jgi:hypothetical protein